MSDVKHGDTVKLHYTVLFDDGTVFESSWEGEPLQFTVGEGTVMKAFELAIVGMSVGETKKINVSSKDAYGPYRDDLIININKSVFPPHIEPIEGLIINLARPDGGAMQAIVIKTTEESVTIDANHPLAGKDLMFEIDLLEISS